MAKQPTPATAREWIAKDVDELRAVWDDLHTESDDSETERRFFGHLLTPEEAGAVFERWVPEAFRLSGARGRHAFSVPMFESDNTREQFDGLVLSEQLYLLEAKHWVATKVDFSPIARLDALIRARLPTTMGLFFSPFGYTKPALQSAYLLRPIKVLLCYRRDLEWALPPRNLTKKKATNFFQGRMNAMVRRKQFFAGCYAAPDPPIDDPMELFNAEEI